MAGRNMMLEMRPGIGYLGVMTEQGNDHGTRCKDTR